jgi:hypothetical protein
VNVGHAVTIEAQVLGPVDLAALGVVAGQVGATMLCREGPAGRCVTFSMAIADPDPLDAATRVLSRLGGLLARGGATVDRVLRLEVTAGEDPGPAAG